MRNNYDSLSIYKKMVKIFNLNVRSLEKSSSLLSSALAQTSAQAIVKSIEVLRFKVPGFTVQS
jgi:hypothetical protein